MLQDEPTSTPPLPKLHSEVLASPRRLQDNLTGKGLEMTIRFIKSFLKILAILERSDRLNFVLK